MRSLRWMAVAVVGLLTACNEDPVNVVQNPGPAATVFSAAGNIAAEVDRFRNTLGPPNGGTAGEQPTGRREIAWDAAVTDPFDNRDDFPVDFFNTQVTVGAVYALDQLFQVAGQLTPAAVRGFGIVFSDVDLAETTTIQLFAQDGSSLGIRTLLPL